MAKFTIEITGEMLTELDALTAEAYEGTAEERIKTYVIDSLKGQVNGIKNQRAVKAVTFSKVSDIEIK